MYSTYLHTGNHIIHELKPRRSAWLHLVKGEILVNQLPLQTGDGIGFSEEKSVSFTAQKPSEILLFDLCELVPSAAKKDGRPLAAEIQPSCAQN
jgi:redox-sensitive bicupin YhaK (pirin superfamily)